MKTHCYTTSGSRYSFRADDNDRVWLEGEAEPRTHARGSTRGMTKDEEFPVIMVTPWPPVKGVGLLICYIPPDLEEGTTYRRKVTSPVERIEVED